MDEPLFDYARYEYVLAACQLALAMLGMGTLLALRDLVEVFRNPRALAVGLAAQLLAVPLVAALFGRAFGLEPGIAAGLVLLAAVPGGTMSNLITYLGRGHIALSIALTAVCSMGALVTAPLILRGLIGPGLIPEFEMPAGRIAFEIGISLLLPLGLGMAIGARWPEWRSVVSKNAIRASLFVIAVMVFGSTTSGRIRIEDYPAATPLLLIGFGAALQLTAVLVARVARVDASQRLAIAVEVTVRNGNLAVLLKAVLFPAVSGKIDPIGDAMFFVALLYSGMAFMIAAPAVLLHRRNTPVGEAPYAAT